MRYAFWVALAVLMLPVAAPAAAPPPAAPPTGAPSGPPGPPDLDPRMPDLFLAVGRSDAEGLRAALKTGVPVDSRNFLGMTALMYAAAIDRPEMAKLLIEAGAQVNAESPFGSCLTLAEA